ncbi:HD domain-containing protein, partial [Candidatus Gracilibacteria bacterium]|nr:HD domain-containing protein [Candidatus Gracilibacteria bacterium]
MNLIENTKQFVKEKLKGAEGGHDYLHIIRVYNNAMNIYEQEGGSGNKEVIELGALLHDIADSKFYNGDETIGPKVAKEFLLSQNIDNENIEHIIKIIENISFK